MQVLVNPEKPMKSRGNINFNKMKNLRELNSNEIIFISGGELPYTENAVNGRALLNQLHQIGDFTRGFFHGFFK